MRRQVARQEGGLVDAEAVRQQLASLQGALSSANASQVVRDAGLSDEQAVELNQLLAV
ncbi:hypothetical protein [Pseudomonas sp. TCU-HL1]|uniref:hypothetical protein n=1 Tax=Pseudomonas sp. TCU-HL1 TaxID=1856685 RepID=UPI0013747FC8|nr:hypothetical protein [Pseudomonas sp. TCU-HL1]